MYRKFYIVYFFLYIIMKKRLCLVFIILVIFSFGNIFNSGKSLCIDTNGNLEESQYKRGYVQDANGIHWDQCMNGNKVIERICKDGSVKNIVYGCENGCLFGACKKYSLFKFPDFGLLPISQKFLTFQKSDERIGSNLQLLEKNLEDLSNRLLRIEKELGLVEPRYFIRISAVNSFESGEIFGVEYFSIDKDWNNVKKENSNDIDLEVLVLNEEFEAIVKSFNINKVELSNFNIKRIAFTEKGKKLK